jgi:AcrR family transcriptional regulator
MDAAEALFIERGYEGTSIRDIARRASSHLGTLHYFWGNKDALFRAVCERRFDAIQAEQLRRLRVCRARLGRGEAVPLAEIVRALVEPPLHVAGASEAERHSVRLLYGRVLTEPSLVVMRIVREMFRESTALFVELMRACNPGLSEDGFYWRLTCTLGAFIFTQSFGDRVAFAAGRRLGAVDWSQVADEVTGFIVRGFETQPAPAARPPGRRGRVRPRAAGSRRHG